MIYGVELCVRIVWDAMRTCKCVRIAVLTVHYYVTAGCLTSAQNNSVLTVSWGVANVNRMILDKTGCFCLNWGISFRLIS